MSAQGWGEMFAALRDRPASGSGDVLVGRALALGHDVAAGMVGCSLTEVVGTACRTPAASTDLALELDLAQYAESAGPCVLAAREGRPQQIDAVAAEPRFPNFVETALRHAVRSSLSVPVPGRDLPTALNLYSSAESAFATERARSTAALLSKMIALVASDQQGSSSAGQSLVDARERGGRVRTALERVMHGSDVDRSAAFAILTARSRERQVGLRTIADEILHEPADPR